MSKVQSIYNLNSRLRAYTRPPTSRRIPPPLFVWPIISEHGASTLQNIREIADEASQALDWSNWEEEYRARGEEIDTIMKTLLRECESLLKGLTPSHIALQNIALELCILTGNAGMRDAPVMKTVQLSLDGEQELRSSVRSLLAHVERCGKSTQGSLLQDVKAELSLIELTLELSDGGFEAHETIG